MEKDLTTKTEVHVIVAPYYSLQVFQGHSFDTWFWLLGTLRKTNGEKLAPGGLIICRQIQIPVF